MYFACQLSVCVLYLCLLYLYLSDSVCMCVSFLKMSIKTWGSRPRFSVLYKTAIHALFSLADENQEMHKHVRRLTVTDSFLLWGSNPISQTILRPSSIDTSSVVNGTVRLGTLYTPISGKSTTIFFIIAYEHTHKTPCIHTHKASEGATTWRS